MTDEPLIAESSFVLDKIYPENWYQLKSVQSVSSEQLKKAVTEYLTRTLSTSSQLSDINNGIFNMIDQIDFKNKTEITSIHSPDGWIISSSLTKKIITLETEFIQETKIDKKD